MQVCAPSLLIGTFLIIDHWHSLQFDQNNAHRALKNIRNPERERGKQTLLRIINPTTRKRSTSLCFPIYKSFFYIWELLNINECTFYKWLPEAIGHWINILFSLFTEKMMKINFFNISFKMILSTTKIEWILFSILTRDNLWCGCSE